MLQTVAHKFVPSRSCWHVVFVSVRRTVNDHFDSFKPLFCHELIDFEKHLFVCVIANPVRQDMHSEVMPAHMGLLIVSRIASGVGLGQKLRKISVRHS